MAGTTSGALEDIRLAFKLKSVWLTLAKEDIGDAHRRTFLGPAWLLLNYLAFTGTLILIIGRADGISNYPAYVACGLLVWLFVSEILTESVSVFVREESFIKGTVLPLSTYVMRQSARSVIRSGYALIGALGILLVSGAAVSPAWLTSIAALVLIVLTAPAVTTLLGVAGVVFPDIQFFMGNIVRLGMFITPVFWAHTGGGGGLQFVLYHWNPITHYLDIFRLPIVSGEIPLVSWTICVALSAILWVAAILVLGSSRKRIVFLL